MSASVDSAATLARPCGTGAKQVRCHDQQVGDLLPTFKVQREAHGLAVEPGEACRRGDLERALGLERGVDELAQLAQVIAARIHPQEQAAGLEHPRELAMHREPEHAQQAVDGGGSHRQVRVAADHPLHPPVLRAADSTAHLEMSSPNSASRRPGAAPAARRRR